jgi:hypothetical protein
MYTVVGLPHASKCSVTIAARTAAGLLDPWGPDSAAVEFQTRSLSPLVPTGAFLPTIEYSTVRPALATTNGEVAETVQVFGMPASTSAGDLHAVYIVLDTVADRNETCTDNKKGTFEMGVDCGGACAILCAVSAAEFPATNCSSDTWCVVNMHTVTENDVLNEVVSNNGNNNVYTFNLDATNAPTGSSYYWHGALFWDTIFTLEVAIGSHN